MDIKEAQEIKNKALSILRKFSTVSALQWIMDQSVNKWVNLKVDTIKKKDGIKTIDKGICFGSGVNKYELFFANGHSFYTPGGGAYMGDFLLFFNDDLVFETTYDKSSDYDDYDEFSYPKKPEILASESFVKLIKLGDWVEEIPQISDFEKVKIAELEEIKKKEKEKSEAEVIQKNFDLGKYE